MQTFLDINSGKPFNGEYNNGKGYVFWFENGQSTNLNYVKTIYVYSKQPTLYVTMKCDKESIFWIMNVQNNSFNTPKQAICDIYGQEYIKLSHLINISNGVSHTTTHGYSVKDLNGDNGYVHAIYILARSLDAGEFIETFKIENDTYAIGADFYAENEILKSNLENLEIRLPESIQKAIYEVNVHEESFDNIMLNRKYKELLMNYWDIVAKKGSYESLVDSLNWFEYGKLVAIKEYWKSHGDYGERYINQDLKEWLPDEVMDQISKMTKTTYIGLYLALQEIHEGEYEDSKGRQPDLTENYISKSIPHKIDDYGIPGLVPARFVQNDNGGANWNVPTVENSKNLIYNEINPKLYHISSMWNGIDLALKMTLLGNFYSTFFAPIHIDLIHSTIENVVYATTLKLINVATQSRIDTVNNVDTFNMTMTFEGNGKTSKMQPHEHLYTFEDTPFCDETKSKIVGGAEFLTENREGNIIPYTGEAICGLVKFSCKVDLLNNEYDAIYKGHLDWIRNGKLEDPNNKSLNCIDNYFNIPVKYNDKDKYSEFDIYLKFLKPGHYNISMTFYTLSGKSYTKTCELDVEDNTSTDIHLYKIRKKDLPKDLNDSASGFDLQELTMQMSYMEQSTYAYQSQFIYVPNSGADVGTNHTIVIIPKQIYGPDMILHKTTRAINENDVYINKSTDINNLFATLTAYYTDYLWKKMKRPVTDQIITNKQGNLINEDTFEDMIIGVCKTHNTRPVQVLWNWQNSKPHPKTRYVDEMRFYTAFHTKIPFTPEEEEARNIMPGEVVCVIPDLKHSLPITDYHWEFENVSTGRKIRSHQYIPNQLIIDKTYNQRPRYYGDFGKLNEVGGNQGMIVADTVNRPLDPGYYDISLHYRVGDEEVVVNYKSAFKITNMQ